MLFNYLDSNKQLAYTLQTEKGEWGEKSFNYLQVSKDQDVESKQMERRIHQQRLWLGKCRYMAKRRKAKQTQREFL